MSKDTLDDILGVTTADLDVDSLAGEGVSDIAESDNSTSDITDAETSSDAVVESTINEDMTQESNAKSAVEHNITRLETDDEGINRCNDDTSVHVPETTDKPSHIFLRKAVPLYRVPNTKSVVTMISGRVTVTGKATGNFVPVQYNRYGVGKLTGYIISHRKDI